MQKIKAYYQESPLSVIILVGLCVRLIAVVFSKGFGWIDDQFLVIEIAQSWADGIDYYNWLPGDSGDVQPKGFSFFYTGIHYIIFLIFKWLGLTDPQGKMYIIRLLHALWSLLIIYYGYKLTLKLSDKSNAKVVGWMLAVFWMFPFLSVRNLVEFVCIPFLIYATYLVVGSKEKSSMALWIWIGLIFGMAFNIRYQTILFTGGVGLSLLIDQKWKQTAFLSVGILAAIALIQGGIDYLVWDKPFIQLHSYFEYNMTHAGEYPLGAWPHYLIFILWALIPPVSFFLVLGFFRTSRKRLVLFIPILIFFVFHSIYPNKQERFITTVVPFIMIAGVIGWKEIAEGIFNPSFMRKWIKISWIIFWVLNFILLVPVSGMYSKKARVESMVYLSKYPSMDYFVIEDSNKDVLRFPPQFYLKKWLPYNAFMKKDNIEGFKKVRNWRDNSKQPDFVLFYQPDNLQARVDQMKTLFPYLVPETVIEPGLMDRLLHWLNPINDNQKIFIYRNEAKILKKIE